MNEAARSSAKPGDCHNSAPYAMGGMSMTRLESFFAKSLESTKIPWIGLNKNGVLVHFMRLEGVLDDENRSPEARLLTGVADQDAVFEFAVYGIPFAVVLNDR